MWLIAQPQGIVGLIRLVDVNVRDMGYIAYRPTIEVSNDQWLMYRCSTALFFIGRGILLVMLLMQH